MKESRTGEDYPLHQKKKKIIDVCCGGRMFWFNKNNPLVDFCDIRSETLTFPGNRKVVIYPDIVADFTNLHFAVDESYKLAVFDPPHLLRGGENSWLVKKYGKLSENWEEVIRDGFNECMRVLEKDGILIFKWSEVDIPISKIIKVIGTQPLFGHRSGKANKTHWMAFMKTEEDYDRERQAQKSKAGRLTRVRHL